MRLPARARAAVFGLTMALLYAGLMSGLFTWRALGSGWTPSLWLQAWAIGFLVAAPAGLVLRPVAEAIARALTSEDAR